MRRQTQTILYHLLPVTFWLLAAGGIVLWSIHLTPYTLHHYIPAVAALLSAWILRHIPRHADSTVPCFQMAILLGIASYWLPTVVFLTLPIWGYLIYKNIFHLRAFCATLIGYALVAIWAAVLVFFGYIENPWAEFFSIENAWGWIPTGAILLAWLGSTIVRQTLRVR